jgi:diaminopimelate epimerase
MILEFEKYQGTGNDFIMLDNMNGQYNWLSANHVSQLCDRRFGVGADGLIRLNRVDGFDFELDYFNADGSKSFCGNGARCGLAFAFKKGYCKNTAYFLGCDGPHEGSIGEELFSVKMKDVSVVHVTNTEDAVIDTGSPHYIQFKEEINDINVVELGRGIRFSSLYEQEGINVNFAKVIQSNHLSIRTYERGVEDETLSCGTGATACAMAHAHAHGITGKCEIRVDVKGGELMISFERNENDMFSNVYLIGPAKMVYKGEIEMNHGNF